MKTYISTIFAVFIGFAGIAQNCEALGLESINRIRTDIAFLANDGLEGRMPGTEGAEMAANYIANEFTNIGLIPMGDGGNYFQRNPRCRANPFACATQY